MSLSVEEESRIPLDEVMLAMDVVDTLRHQRAQVESELNEEARERQLIARVKSIYSSQGMDVPEDVIQQGVQALVEDRFVYEPPVRSFSVRLAEVYVDRGKWALRSLVVSVLALAGWAAFAVPAHLRRQDAIGSFEATMASLDGAALQLERRVMSLHRSVESGRDPDGPAAATAIFAEAEQALDGIGETLDGLQSALDAGPAPETYPENQVRLDRDIQSHRDVLAEVERDLGIVDGKLQSVRRLGSLLTKANLALTGLSGIEVDTGIRDSLADQQKAVLLSIDGGDADRAETQLTALTSRVQALVASQAKRRARETELARLSNRLAGVEIDAATMRELQGLKTSVAQAIAADYDGNADRDMRKLRALVTLLDSSYELRIATGRGKRAGVWRYDRGRRSGNRNYYIIVEAINPRGRPIRMSITNEETNRTSKVATWGIRVPQRVYEAVKQDKLDNGIVDNRVFGVKRRGARSTEYRFAVAGGKITRWDN